MCKCLQFDILINNYCTFTCANVNLSIGIPCVDALYTWYVYASYLNKISI